jgi:hypothetical protein
MKKHVRWETAYNEDWHEWSKSLNLVVNSVIFCYVQLLYLVSKTLTLHTSHILNNKILTLIIHSVNSQ